MTFSFASEAPQMMLLKAPLVQAMCQIRFAPVPELVDDDNERKLAALLDPNYPIRGTVQGAQLSVFGGPANLPVETFRTFEDVDGYWKVTVAQDAVTLETSAYFDRDDLLERTSAVLKAVAQVRKPPKVTRVGVRYTDRILKPQGLRALVQPSLLGMLSEVENDILVDHQSTQVGLNDVSTNSQVLVRSLLLPANARFDPNISPVDGPSWVLDIDSSNQDSLQFVVDEVIERARLLAKRAYQVFYWAVTDEFRTNYGVETGAES